MPARSFLESKNALEPRRGAAFCPVSRPLWRRLFRDYRLAQTLVLYRLIGRRANSSCHVMTSHRLRCRRARSLPPPPGPDIWFLYPSSPLKGAVWESRREFFPGGIEKSIVREGEFGMMCDLRRMKSGKK